MPFHLVLSLVGTIEEVFPCPDLHNTCHTLRCVGKYYISTEPNFEKSLNFLKSNFKVGNELNLESLVEYITEVSLSEKFISMSVRAFKEQTE